MNAGSQPTHLIRIQRRHRSPRSSLLLLCPRSPLSNLLLHAPARCTPFLAPLRLPLRRALRSCASAARRAMRRSPKYAASYADHRLPSGSVALARKGWNLESTRPGYEFTALDFSHPWNSILSISMGTITATFVLHFSNQLTITRSCLCIQERHSYRYGL